MTTFFGVKTLPRPAVAGELLNKVNANDMANDANYKLLRYMDLAMCRKPREESAVEDFAVHLLGLLDYVPRSRMAHTRADILLTICGQERHTKTDVCIVDSKEVLLLVQEDKRWKESKDPEPQLIAEAIAAFQTNSTRTRILGQGHSPVVHKVMLGITLRGTFPVFYKIPVTIQLAQCVAQGVYPAERTIVHAHIPEMARPADLSEGMKPLDNRTTILACYEAFKRFLL